ncbi:MAG: hypothetical protein CME62_04295 [Halobacteriovoraceae bacterium]|nr:hypothetical protein [Halobacteriovoraceae bacterium]|tara:strand:+ start:2823 stop:3317 length:495 start_codon:yes stop_codon:yes gene_type:complete
MKTFNNFFSQCHNDLKEQGYTQLSVKVPESINEAVMKKNYVKLDQLMAQALEPQKGWLSLILLNFTQFSKTEYIISLREAGENEEGIWHDDGSRILAFSLSLTLDEVGGGILEFRKKGSKDSMQIKTPPFGDMIVFKTGHEGYEHKINEVTQGSRLIIAGWCYA